MFGIDLNLREISLSLGCKNTMKLRKFECLLIVKLRWEFQREQKSKSCYVIFICNPKTLISSMIEP